MNANRLSTRELQAQRDRLVALLQGRTRNAKPSTYKALLRERLRLMNAYADQVL